MSGAADTIGRYLHADHDRLEGLLVRAVARPESIDREAYDAFRRGLLRHIGIEEKILLPAARERAGGPLPAAARLRLDHGALAALLVPTPTPAIVGAIRAILAGHNRLEEDPGGVYETCEQILGADDPKILAAVRGAPEVAASTHADGELVVAATRRALMRAGYDPETLGL